MLDASVRSFIVTVVEYTLCARRFRRKVTRVEAQTELADTSICVRSLEEICVARKFVRKEAPHRVLGYTYGEHRPAADRHTKTEMVDC